MEYYCIFVKVGEEESFKKQAREQILTLDEKSDLYFFSEEAWEGKAKHNKKTARPAFPGYVFFKTEKLTPQMVNLLKKIKGFFHFLATNENICKIEGLGADSLIHFIETGERHVMSKAVYEKGNKVRIIQGDIKDFEAYITHWDPVHQKVRVQLPNQWISWSFELSYEIIMEKLPDDETSLQMKGKSTENCSK